jgi:hypothetical protein
MSQSDKPTVEGLMALVDAFGTEKRIDGQDFRRTDAYTTCKRREAVLAYAERLVAPSQPATKPIDMVLHCPMCGLQQIDAPDANPQWCVGCSPDGENGTEVCSGCGEGKGKWTNPPHRSHLCHGCKYVWRPADVPTNGVTAVKTKGKDDSPLPR